MFLACLECTSVKRFSGDNVNRQLQFTANGKGINPHGPVWLKHDRARKSVCLVESHIVFITWILGACFELYAKHISFFFHYTVGKKGSDNNTDYI